MNEIKSAPIGVFDSGIGGLSVLKQFVKFLPQESYIYLGDTARVPYGNRSTEKVSQYASDCTDVLLSKGVKLIVAACNTVSSVALKTVVEKSGDIPVIGMINPAAVTALRATVNKKIGVIGTRATISSSAYSKAIKNLSGKNDVEVYSQSCPLFVPLVEEGMRHHRATREIAEEYLASLKAKAVDTIVLGCTHYPLLIPLIMDIMPGVTLIDSGESAAVTALRLLAEEKKLIDEKDTFVEKPRVDFLITDLPALFYENAAEFLGFEIDHPKIINWD